MCLHLTQISTAESCDDGNVINGDGCSSSCRIEGGYHCVVAVQASASRCYVHCGDGVCEAFEAEECVKDCGYSWESLQTR